MATDNGPKRDVSPSKEGFSKKSIGADWGATNEAGNAPNTPSMKEAKHKASVNLYADYCDESEENTARTPWGSGSFNDKDE